MGRQSDSSPVPIPRAATSFIDPRSRKLSPTAMSFASEPERGSLPAVVGAWSLPVFPRLAEL